MSKSSDDERAERCATCRFWDNVEGLSLCRRSPPAFAARQIEPDDVEGGGTDGARGFWPVTDNDDWCGEWQAIAEVAGPGDGSVTIAELCAKHAPWAREGVRIRLLTTLEHHGIKTVNQVCEHTPLELIERPINLSSNGLTFLEAALSVEGRSLLPYEPANSDSACEIPPPG
jgi:hypothetical protein